MTLRRALISPSPVQPATTLSTFPGLRWRLAGLVGAPQAFSPVAINIDRWAADFYKPGPQTIPVTLINDTYLDQQVTVDIIAADLSGEVLSRSDAKVIDLAALGSEHPVLQLEIPEEGGFVLYASIRGEFSDSAIYSRRKVRLSHPGVIATLPPHIHSEISGD